MAKPGIETDDEAREVLANSFQSEVEWYLQQAALYRRHYKGAESLVGQYEALAERARALAESMRHGAPLEWVPIKRKRRPPTISTISGWTRNRVMAISIFYLQARGFPLRGRPLPLPKLGYRYMTRDARESLKKALLGQLDDAERDVQWKGMLIAFRKAGYGALDIAGIGAIPAVGREEAWKIYQKHRASAALFWHRLMHPEFITSKRKRQIRSDGVVRFDRPGAGGWRLRVKSP